MTPPPAVGSPGARRVAPSAVASNIEVHLSSGERLRVAGRGVIGRDPSEAPGSFAHRITLADTEKLLSRAHLEFGLEGDGQFWICDLHSTNGVVLERPGQAPQRCQPGDRVVIQPGDRVAFGGRILSITAR